MRERAPFARALGVVAGQAQELESLGRRLSRSQRYMPHVSASRPNSFSRCAEPPPRSPNRGRVAASRRGRSPAQLGQRAGGLRYSRLHSGVCSHTSHICWAARASQASRDEPGCTARVVFVSAVSEGAQDVCVDEDHGMSGYSPKPPASSSSTCSEMSLRPLSPIPTNAGSWRTCWSGCLSAPMSGLSSSRARSACSSPNSPTSSCNRSHAAGVGPNWRRQELRA